MQITLNIENPSVDFSTYKDVLNIALAFAANYYDEKNTEWRKLQENHLGQCDFYKKRAWAAIQLRGSVDNAIETTE